MAAPDLIVVDTWLLVKQLRRMAVHENPNFIDDMLQEIYWCVSDHAAAAENIRQFHYCLAKESFTYGRDYLDGIYADILHQLAISVFEQLLAFKLYEDDGVLPYDYQLAPDDAGCGLNLILRRIKT